MRNIKSFRIILSILITAAAGFCLRYFELDTYIILLGFRFHLSFLLPFLLILPVNFKNILKKIFLSPVHKLKLLPLLWILISSGIVFLLLFILKEIKIGDPEFFYEFGLSSIVDYPVYLLWNSIQLILLFIYLNTVTINLKNKFFPVFLTIIFLFAFEFVPVVSMDINYLNFADLFITAICAGLFFQYYQNVYWFVILYFSLFWINYLAFGSSSEEIINILFAAQYSGWDGFFIVNKIYKPYLLSAQLLIFSVTMLLSLPFRSAVKVEKAPSAFDPSF